MRDLTVGQLAKKERVNLEKVRYYELRGLIPKPPRGDSGYRPYPRDTVSSIQAIKRAKELGFSLKEISELLSLEVDPATTCGDVKRRAEIKIPDYRCRLTNRLILHFRKVIKPPIKPRYL